MVDELAHPKTSVALSGYYELVAAMKTRRGSAYRHWRELNGGIFDPSAFDLEETNDAIDHWIREIPASST